MMYTIVFTNVGQKVAGMAALERRIEDHHTWDWADDVAEAGEVTIRGIAREDTGLMAGSIGKRVAAMGGVGVATAGYGVDRYNAPFYTKFQELGTSHGITPMLSIPAAETAMEVASTNAGMKMLAKIAGEWSAI